MYVSMFESQYILCNRSYANVKGADIRIRDMRSLVMQLWCSLVLIKTVSVCFNLEIPFSKTLLNSSADVQFECTVSSNRL